MYTQTGYDASAHTAEETRGAADRRRAGRVEVGVLLGDRRLGGADRAGLRGDPRRRHQQGRRRLDPGHHDRPELVRGQVRADHLHGRSAVLRDGRADQRVADVVRVLARPRRCPAGALFRRAQPPPRAQLRGARRGGRLADHHASRRCGATRRASRSRSSRSPGSARSASTSPTSSRCTCACGTRTSSSPARGPWGATTRWINYGAIFFVVVTVISLDLPFTQRGGAVEQRLRLDGVQLHAARASWSGSSSRSGGRCRRRTGTRARCARSRPTSSGA